MKLISFKFRCCTREESEVFMARLTPIATKMSNVEIGHSHYPSVFYALQAGLAGENYDNFGLIKIFMEDMIFHTKVNVLYNNEIQDRRVSKWINVVFFQF